MTLLIVLAVVYGIGVIVTFAVAAGSYKINEDYPQLPKYREDKRRHATQMMAAPFWPALLVRALAKLIAQAKEALKEEA